MAYGSGRPRYAARAILVTAIAVLSAWLVWAGDAADAVSRYGSLTAARITAGLAGFTR